MARFLPLFSSRTVTVENRMKPAVLYHSAPTESIRTIHIPSFPPPSCLSLTSVAGSAWANVFAMAALASAAESTSFWAGSTSGRMKIAAKMYRMNAKPRHPTEHPHSSDDLAGSAGFSASACFSGGFLEDDPNGVIKHLYGPLHLGFSGFRLRKSLGAFGQFPRCETSAVPLRSLALQCGHSKTGIGSLRCVYIHARAGSIHRFHFAESRSTM